MRMRLFIALVVPFLFGCTSMRSTMLNRAEDDSLSGNSNGDWKWFGMARPFRGVPITIKVPTHVDIKVIETSYLYDSGTGLREFRLSIPHREVDIVPIETEKVFTVDFKRPLSGSLNYKATFGTDQYFDEISGKLEDTTITDVANLVATVVPMFGKKSASPLDSKSGLGAELIVNKRIVAYKRFDIDACDFEAQIRAFLEEHVNCGHTCDSYDRVDEKDAIEPSDHGNSAILPPATTPKKS